MKHIALAAEAVLQDLASGATAAEADKAAATEALRASREGRVPRVSAAGRSALFAQLQKIATTRPVASVAHSIEYFATFSPYEKSYYLYVREDGAGWPGERVELCASLIDWVEPQRNNF